MRLTEGNGENRPLLIVSGLLHSDEFARRTDSVPATIRAVMKGLPHSVPERLSDGAPRNVWVWITSPGCVLMV